MKIAHVCLENPFFSGKGDGKVIRERLLVLRSLERDIDLIIFSWGFRSSLRKTEQVINNETSVSIVRLRLPIWGLISALCRRGVYKLWHLPVQTWSSVIYADCYRYNKETLLEGYRTVHLYHIRSFGLCDLVDRDRQSLVLDCIDSYTLNMSSRSSLMKSGLQKSLIEWELRRISRLESSLSSYIAAWKSSSLLTVSRKDLGFFKGIGPRGVVIPVGIEIIQEEEVQIEVFSGKKLKCIFFGNLDYGPNISASLEIAKTARIVRQSIGALRDNIQFTVAGRHISRQLERHLVSEAINVISPVENMKELVMDHDIAVLPMVSGSGMQSKVLEAIAWGRLVIATHRCAEPIQLKEDIHYLRAESPEQIVSTLEDIMSQRIDTKRIRRNAYRHVLDFSWKRTALKLDRVYRQGWADLDSHELRSRRYKSQECDFE